VNSQEASQVRTGAKRLPFDNGDLLPVDAAVASLLF